MSAVNRVFLPCLQKVVAVAADLIEDLLRGRSCTDAQKPCSYLTTEGWAARKPEDAKGGENRKTRPGLVS
jgi:hypothetical protein